MVKTFTNVYLQVCYMEWVITENLHKYMLHVGPNSKPPHSDFDFPISSPDINYWLCIVIYGHNMELGGFVVK